MRTRSNTHTVCLALLATLVLGALLVSRAAADGNIDPARRYAWSTSTGWINFSPAHGGVAVYDDHLEGYVWSENVGWIRLGVHTGGGSHTYANTSNADYGVNVGVDGALSGYAWSTNAGWINFAPTHGGVRIDPASGSFSGYAWSENTGWIHFKSDTYNVALLLVTHTLTITTAGEGSGVVTPTVGTHAYVSGTLVILGATPHPGSSFAGWSGDVDCADGSVIMNANKICTAAFALYKLYLPLILR